MKNQEKKHLKAENRNISDEIISNKICTSISLIKFFSS